MAAAYHIKVGRVVRLIRELQGITLRDMAKRMGLTSSGWSRCETGDTILSVSQLDSAAKILKMKPSIILQKVESLD